MFSLLLLLYIVKNEIRRLEIQDTLPDPLQNPQVCVTSTNVCSLVDLMKDDYSITSCQ